MFRKLLDDIASYRSLLEEIDKSANILKSDALLKHIDISLKTTPANPKEAVCYLIKHLDFVFALSKRCEIESCNHINTRGEIEPPTYYPNVGVVEYAHTEQGVFPDKIIDIIKNRQSRLIKKLDKLKRDGILKEWELLYQLVDNKVVVYSRGDATSSAMFVLLSNIQQTLNVRHDIKISFFPSLQEHICPISHKGISTSTYIKNFTDWLSGIQSFLEASDYEFGIIHAQNEKSFIDDQLQKQLEKCNINTTTFTDDRTSGILERSYNIMSLEFPQVKPIKKIMPQKTIGVICAKENETISLLKQIKETFSIEPAHSYSAKENQRLIYRAEIQLDSTSHNVYVTQQFRQGNTSAASAYAALSRYKCDYIFFVGIAGSLTPKINIGDVIIPPAIFDSTLKKQKDDGNYQIRGELFHIHSENIGRLQYFMHHCNYDEFCVYSVPIMSDNTVFAAENSSVVKDVLTFNNQIAGVEMESAGLYNADYESKKTKHGILTIRGVSDRADNNKNDDFQELAARNAATVFCDFVKTLVSE